MSSSYSLIPWVTKEIVDASSERIIMAESMISAPGDHKCIPGYAIVGIISSLVSLLPPDNPAQAFITRIVLPALLEDYALLDFLAKACLKNDPDQAHKLFRPALLLPTPYQEEEATQETGSPLPGDPFDVRLN
jgi:hypothetical protein